MVELVFVVCMLGAPERCEERSLLYLARPDLDVCMAVAPPHLAGWIAEHPGYRIASWRCRNPADHETNA